MVTSDDVEAARQPEIWRPILARLRRDNPAVFRNRDLGYIDSLTRRPWLERLSEHQARWLLDVEARVAEVTMHEGRSVEELLGFCWGNLVDIEDEDDAEWVATLRDSGRALRLNEARELYRIVERLERGFGWNE